MRGRRWKSEAGFSLPGDLECQVLRGRRGRGLANDIRRQRITRRGGGGEGQGVGIARTPGGVVALARDRHQGRIGRRPTRGVG